MGGADDLSVAVGRILGGTVRSLRRLSGGASRETWSFDLATGERDVPMILRREPASETDPTALRRESVIIEAAGACGVRVPRIFAFDDGSALGRPGMAMSRIDGEALPTRILRTLGARQRAALLRDVVGQLARIHAIPVTAVELPTIDGLEFWARRLGDLTDERPALEVALQWLRANRPDPIADVVVHGDYRMGNLLVHGDQITAVLDWELTHLGDPYEDLGWLCTKAWRFGEAAPAGGLGGYDELLDAYAEAIGAPADPRRLRWWEVMSHFKWAVMCVQQYQIHATGREQSLELASLGWRTCEAEWDLLNLLTDAPRREVSPLVAADPSLSEPTVADMLTAISGALRSESIPATDGRVQFTLRIAARLIEAAARLSEWGQDVDRATASALSRSFGTSDPRAAAALVRAPEWTWDPDVVTTLRDLTGDRLALINPRYRDQPFPAPLTA